MTAVDSLFRTEHIVGNNISPFAFLPVPGKIAKSLSTSSSQPLGMHPL